MTVVQGKRGIAAQIETSIVHLRVGDCWCTYTPCDASTTNNHTRILWNYEINVKVSVFMYVALCVCERDSMLALLALYWNERLICCEQ